MLGDNRTIIADSAGAAAERRAHRLAFVAALLLGAAAAVYYAQLDLTLSHYDARAHLVVARRAIDSLTPGWRQFGVVWLPLPHVVNALPVQWDWAYRTGAVATAVSVVALAMGLAALARYLRRHTASVGVAVASPLVILLNPNVLYLQSTPMTEPLLLGLSLVALDVVDRWMTRPEPAFTRRAGWVLVALVMTRYEGWLVAAGLLAMAGLQRGRSHPRQVLSLALYPAATIAIYVTVAVAVTGTWFLRTDFFVPDNPSRGRPFAVVDDIAQSLQRLAGPLVTGGAAVGALALGVRGAVGRSAAPLLPLALGSTALLPFLAFLQGHPHRERYMVPLIAAAGTVAALALTLLPARFRGIAAAALLAGALWVRPPLALEAPMIVEAQWEAPYRSARRAVSAALAHRYDGTPILASMGSLAHYMHDASTFGLNLRDFLHEGNGDLWSAALASPSRYVRWILIEEQAEGGDMLAALARDRHDFLSGFTRVTDGGGLALYERGAGPESSAPAR